MVLINITDLVAAMWDGMPVAEGDKIEHVTCRDGMKMNPDWTTSPLEATCNEHFEWELSSNVDYSCVPGTIKMEHSPTYHSGKISSEFQFISGNVCPSPPDGPAGDLQPTATLVHPGINFSGECLGVGLPDDEVKLYEI